MKLKKNCNSYCKLVLMMFHRNIARQYTDIYKNRDTSSYKRTIPTVQSSTNILIINIYCTK